MSTPVTRWVAALTVCLAVCSCGKKGPVRKETFPVSGQVFVDGQPAARLAVRCVSLGEPDPELPTFSHAYTDPQGNFRLSTYESGDGVPAGQYALTFTWGDLNLMTMSEGPDKLKGRYSDPKTSQYRITVEKGKRLDPLRIELSTK
ncbi:MAG: hypothetical protein ACUVUC_15970 [Thermoguttaceae bacterium]